LVSSRNFYNQFLLWSGDVALQRLNQYEPVSTIGFAKNATQTVEQFHP